MKKVVKVVSVLLGTVALSGVGVVIANFIIGVDTPLAIAFVVTEPLFLVVFWLIAGEEEKDPLRKLAGVVVGTMVQFLVVRSIVPVSWEQFLALSAVVMVASAGVVAVVSLLLLFLGRLFLGRDR